MSEIESLSSCYTHRMTIHLDHSMGDYKVTIDTVDPEGVQKTLIDALNSYYSPRWWKRRVNCLVLPGSPVSVIPLQRVVCFKIDPIKKTN